MLKQIGFHLGLGLVGMVILAVSGCGSKLPTPVQPMEYPADAGAQAITQLDTNNDHVLEYKELAKAPGLKAGVAKIKNLSTFRGPPPSESQLQSQKVTAEEIDARIQQWKEHGCGRTAAVCRVFHVSKGNKVKTPISGALVEFVPEAFLGKGLSTGTGTTDKAGSAMISQPSRGAEDPESGIFPGFYRVKITKGSEIPANYNTATTLGVEIAPDCEGSAEFNLEY